MTEEKSALQIRVGCSGWSYPDWKKAGFYPKGSKPGEYLKHYAEHFNTVEVDGSYYRSPSPDDCKRWADLTPDGFMFSMKFPKGVVHGGGPRDRELVEENIWNWENTGGLAESFVRATEKLGGKLGSIVLQCPRYPKRIYPTWHEFLEAVAAFIHRLGKQDYCVEIRNGNWIEPDFLVELRKLKLSLVMADFRNADGFDKKTFPQARSFLDNPADFVSGKVAYVRLIGDRWNIEQVTKKWGAIVMDRGTQIKEWAVAITHIAKSEKIPVVAYTNNHFAGHGPETARDLIRELQELDLTT